MSQTLNIPEDLYARLELTARLRGVSIAQLLEEWAQRDAELKRRIEVGQRVDAIFERMQAKYGVMPDSAELVRADREQR
jgi:hypothetical protein